MSTTSRRVCAQFRKNKPSRTKSNRAKLYAPMPPKEGWPAFSGGNWSAYGLRNRKG
jgi:hypothetical protein